jgi:hypothetical protein
MATGEQENQAEADRLRQRPRSPGTEKLIRPGGGVQDDREGEDERDDR